MQFLYEIFPVFLFFIAFKWYGIYAATITGIVATFLQVVFNRLYYGQWDKKQVITLAVFVVFGGLTLYFHDPIFVKWKPTIIFWIFSFAILVTQLFTKKPLTQRLMEKVVEGKGDIPAFVWRRINFLWCVFFLTLGGINLYIAYEFSNDAWVNFKFYGITSALFALGVIQAVYLSRYIEEEKKVSIGEERRLEILKRMVAAFSPEEIEVIDESDSHIGHAGHQGGGRHFAIIMNAKSLTELGRVKAHQRIYAEVQDMMPHDVHALRIILNKA